MVPVPRDLPTDLLGLAFGNSLVLVTETQDWRLLGQQLMGEAAYGFCHKTSWYWGGMVALEECLSVSQWSLGFEMAETQDLLLFFLLSPNHVGFCSYLCAQYK